MVGELGEAESQMWFGSSVKGTVTCVRGVQ